MIQTHSQTIFPKSRMHFARDPFLNGCTYHFHCASDALRHDMILHYAHGLTARIPTYCSLYKKIDLSKVQCLNESEDGAGKTVFKPWDERFDREKVHPFTVFHLRLHMYGIRLKTHYTKFTHFMRYFMDKVNRQSVCNLLCECSRQFLPMLMNTYTDCTTVREVSPSCTRNPPEVLNYIPS